MFVLIVVAIIQFWPETTTRQEEVAPKDRIMLQVQVVDEEDLGPIANAEVSITLAEPCLNYRRIRPESVPC